MDKKDFIYGSLFYLISCLRIINNVHSELVQMQIQDPSEDQIHDYGLYLINEILHKGGKSLWDYPPMRLPQNNWSAIVGNRLISVQWNYDPVVEQQLADAYLPDWT